MTVEYISIFPYYDDVGKKQYLLDSTGGGFVKK